MNHLAGLDFGNPLASLTEKEREELARFRARYDAAAPPVEKQACEDVGAR